MNQTPQQKKLEKKRRLSKKRKVESRQSHEKWLERRLLDRIPREFYTGNENQADNPLAVEKPIVVSENKINA